MMAIPCREVLTLKLTKKNNFWKAVSYINWKNVSAFPSYNHFLIERKHCMKHKFYHELATILFIILFSCSSPDGSLFIQDSETLEDGFVSPPDSIQTSVYWYWLSDNISKEGVIKDLHAMKKVGINRAFIGNIGIEAVPYGKVKIFSDEWWEILHLALKTATELNIEIGIFNSPGWSQSGGPWIRSEESMRYIASSSITVEGPQKIAQKLERPKEPFQSVKVIAFPHIGDDNMTLTHQNAIIQSKPSSPNLINITDGDISTGLNLHDKREFQLTFKTEDSFTARSLTLHTIEEPFFAHAVLKAKQQNGELEVITEFDIDRSRPSLNVGFVPFAPVVISLPATSSNQFNLILTDISPQSVLAEVKLSSIPRVERYSEKTLAKMHQTPYPYWDTYLWPKQSELDDKCLAVNSNDILDITQHVSSEGIVTWDIPEGKWVIMNMGMTPTQVKNGPASPEAIGLEVDKMSKKWVSVHFDRFLGEILRRIPREDRKAFKVVVQDSYETGGQNFTDNLIQEFKERYNYDPILYFPVYEGFVVNSQSESDRFLWDMRRLIADKIAYDYVGGLRQVSHQHGLTTWLENYGHWGFPSEFLMYGGQSDEISGEFWSQGELGDIENRAATSAGHIYGKNRISAESNTSGGPAYSRHPAIMKQRTDRFFAEGINNTLLHVYIMQPYEDKKPGVNAWFGNEFDRKNTWFQYLDLFTQYLKRTNYMLQQGLNVADVAYFIGEDVPKMTGVTDPSLPIGYQFDYINAEVILRDMTVQNGLFTLPHGTQYRVLVLPKQETMRPEVLAKIKELVYDGAVVLGPPPNCSPSLENQPKADNLVRKMAAELWEGVDGLTTTHKKYGKGFIMNGLTMDDVFAIIQCIPDCKLPNDHSIHYGHRKKDEIEIYFISNQTNEEQVIYPEFRVKGKQPELWEATTGSIRYLPAYESKENSTIVPMKLTPYESAFVVFRHLARHNPLQNISDNYPDLEIVENLRGPWKLTFDSSKRGPVEPITIDTLKDWTTFSDKQVKYYSGEVIYQIQFTIQEKEKEKKILIDLGNLTAMAKITVNDEYVGGVWTAPYRLDITNQVKTGYNELTVTVVNNWMNRIIGDMNLPEDQRKTWCFVNPYDAQSPLQPSGLFGPVTINTVKTTCNYP